MVTLIVLLVFAVSFGITLFCLRQFAVWMGAGQSSYTSCFFALLLAYGVSFGVMKGVELAEVHPGVMVLSVPIVILIYAMMLQTGFFKAVAIVILSGIVSTVLIFILMMGVGVLGLGAAGAAMLGMGMTSMDGAMHMEADPGAAFMVSTPDQGTWQGTMNIGETTSADGMVVTRRTTTRSDGTTTVTITRQRGAVTSSTSARPAEPKIPSPAADRPSSKPRASRSTFAFQTIGLDTLPSRKNTRLKLRTKDGREHTGVLVKIDKENVTLRKRISGGAFDFDVHLEGIAEAKVWSRVST